MAISSHRSLVSLRNYICSPSREQLGACSDILSDALSGRPHQSLQPSNLHVPLNSDVVHSQNTRLNSLFFLFGLDASLSFLSTSQRWWINEFPRHLRDVERNNNETSKPVAGHFNLPNNSKQHMAVCSLSLHLGSSESCKTLEKNLSSKSALLIPTVSTSAFHSTN